MTPTGTFWALVRHEFKLKGSWRKRNRSPIAKWWWVAYVSLIVIAAVSATTYFAINNTLRLENLWFVTLGLPYVLFFLGFGSLKREWENDTFGWWLTMPYPRLWLVGSKWIGGLLRAVSIWMILFMFGTVYATVIALSLESYSFADVGIFMKAGFQWLFLMIGFSPLLTSLGILTASAQYTAIRPLTPILWVAFMGGGGLLYSGLPSGGANGDNFAAIMPFTWNIVAAMAVGFLVAYAVIRLCAYLLEHKLHV